MQFTFVLRIWIFYKWIRSIYCLNSFLGIEHCYAAIYDIFENTAVQDDTQAKWNLQAIPAARIKRSTAAKNKLSKTVVTNIFRKLHSQRAFSCFMFFGIEFFGPDNIGKFLEDFSDVKCGALGPNLETISACHPRETYFLGLYVDDTYQNFDYNRVELTSTKAQFYAIRKDSNGTLNYGIQSRLSTDWEIFTTLKTTVSKEELDNLYLHRAIKKYMTIVWATPTKRGKSYLDSFIVENRLQAPTGLTDEDKVNLNIFNAIMFRSDASFESGTNTFAGGVFRQEVIVQTARPFVVYSNEDQSTNLWLFVENYEFGLISCSKTYLKNDRFLSVFGPMVWVILMLSLAAIGCFIAIYLTLVKLKPQLSKSRIVAEFIVRYLLEQCEEPNTVIYQTVSFKMFLIVVLFASLMLPNTYRGKLSMHFTSPPMRSKIQSINEGLDNAFTILTDMDDHTQSDMQAYSIAPWEYDTTSKEMPQTFVERQYWFTSRFYKLIYSYYRASTNETKKKYEAILQKFVNTTTNPHWKASMKEVLLNCSQTMMIAQSSSLYKIFVRLQQQKFKPNLYLNRDIKYVSPRVWVLREYIGWDRNNILNKLFQSILHSGIFKYWVNRDQWDENRSIEEIAEKLDLHDYDNDKKFDTIFICLLVLEFMCIFALAIEFLPLGCGRKNWNWMKHILIFLRVTMNTIFNLRWLTTKKNASVDWIRNSVNCLRA